MKSKLYLVALAAMVLSACSSEEVVTPKDQSVGKNVIAFRVAVPQTRGVETNVTSIEENGFWARAVKSDGTYLWDTTLGVLKFTHDAESDFYTADLPAGSDIDMTWPDEAISFYAFNKDPKVDAYTPYIREYNPVEWYLYQEKNVSDQVDFVYATNKGTSDDFASRGVHLEFKHPLVQVEVRAKCESSKYDVKVKGYKIHYSVSTNPFTLPAPVTTNSVISANNGLTQPDGTYTSQIPETLIGMYTEQPSQDILSGFYGGYTSVAVELTGNDVQISNGDQGTAFLLPPRGTLPAYDVTTASGVYIALLVQVNDKEGNPIFPGLDSTTGKRVSYRGLPAGYGYLYVPVAVEWQSYIGKKVVFTFDLSQGLGKVDPSVPVTVNPDTYDPESDVSTLPLDSDKKGGTDPFSPNQEVTVSDQPTEEPEEEHGNDMEFTFTTTTWENVNQE